MITAVDSSVLLSIYKGEPRGESWIAALTEERRLGRLVVCDIVLAEVSALFDGEGEVLLFIHDLGIEYDPVTPKTALLAGQIFKAYRRAGGPREHLIPDFLIGAHAGVQAGQIAATDRGFLRKYFPRLKVIAPR